MDSKEQRSSLRGAVYRGDGPAVHLLRDAGTYDDALQLAGDGVIAAVIQRVEGASELGHDLVLALRNRGWAGDAGGAAIQPTGGYQPPDRVVDFLGRP